MAIAPIILLGVSLISAGGGLIARPPVKLISQSHVPAIPTPSPAEPKTRYESYRGVTVGMSQAQAREKLGAAEQRSNSGDYYVFSTTESAQVLFDRDQTVKSITVNYTGNIKTAPSPKEILGEDAKKESDGSIYKLVRYPSAGFWVSFNRTAGDGPTIIVTLQKMPKE